MYTIQNNDGSFTTLASYEAKVLLLKGHTILLSIVEHEVQFCTFKGVDSDLTLNTPLTFDAVNNIFSIKDILEVKNSLLEMITEYFLRVDAYILTYTPSCPRRDGIYLSYLKRTGLEVYPVGDGSYTIVN